MGRAHIIIAMTLLTARLAHASGPAGIEEMIDAMSPRERLAQMLMAGFSGTRMNDEIRRLAGEWHCGAIAIYSRNITSPAQLRTLTKQIRDLSGDATPPLIAIDQEGGEVARIADGVPQLPGQMALGATRSPQLAERAGRALGGALRDLGVDLNLAPVLDLATNPRSPIGIRAYSSDPDLAGRLGAAFIRGQHAAGVASAAKHFPGIGATAADSHDILPSIDLREENLAPFRAAIRANVDALLVAHAAVPSVDGSTPASLSPRVIAIARDRLRFDGVIITDVLEMGALDRRAGAGSLAVRSILAGADLVMVLWHERDREEVLAALEAARRSGELSDARIRQSLRRILRLKLRLAAKPVAVQRDTRIADDIAIASMTLVRNRGAVIPLTRARMTRERIAYIGPAGPIRSAIVATRSIELPSYIAPEAVAHWSDEAGRTADGATIIVGVAQNDAQLAAIRAAHDANRKAALILVSIGSPHMLASIPDAAAYLCAYGYLPPSQRAAAAVLVGRVEPAGVLPVPIERANLRRNP